MKNIKVTFQSFLNENLNDNIVEFELDEAKDIIITIILHEEDEKELITGKSLYDVSYEFTFGNERVEIKGTLSSIDYNIGFEADNFTTDEAEEYYNENWEEIEEEIIKKFNDMK